MGWELPTPNFPQTQPKAEFQIWKILLHVKGSFLYQCHLGVCPMSSLEEF
jgi:hypothetical protein